MRDPHKLAAFQLADELAVAVFKHTAAIPADERFGLTMQIRRMAVSVPSNVVEGCSPNSEGDYLRFLDMALGSACELEYQLSRALRLSFLSEEASRQAFVSARLISAKTDYTVTIPISGQAKLDFYTIDGDHHQVTNNGTMMVPNVKTAQPY